MDDDLDPKEEELEDEDFGGDDFEDAPIGKKKRGKGLEEDDNLDIDDLAAEDDAILPEDSYDDVDPL